MDLLNNDNFENENPALTHGQDQVDTSDETSPFIEVDVSNQQENGQQAQSTFVQPDSCCEQPAFDPRFTRQESQMDSDADSSWVYDEPNRSARKTVKSGKLIVRVIAAVLTVALIIGSCMLTATIVSDRLDSQLQLVTKRYDARIEALEKQIESAAGNTGNSVSGSPVVIGNGLTPSQVYAANVESVVMIYAEVATSVFGQVSKSTSTGSGFVLTDNGHIVTNYHVVENATSLSVLLFDGREIQAELVGADSANDVALLKIEVDGLRAVKVGSSSKLIVGDQVVAIGNPLGELTSTLTVGYVSAKERDVSTDGTVINMIQTDAAINSGNSGGPLFNMYGEVVGITTAKYSGTSNSGATIEGIGFAIPIDDVYDMLDDLMNYGYITGAYMGIEVSDINTEAATYFGYPMGAYVHSVERGSCAEKAGILAKDVIIELGGYEVGSLNELSRALRKFDAGDTTTVVVYRLGQEISLDITFDPKPQADSTP